MSRPEHVPALGLANRLRTLHVLAPGLVLGRTVATERSPVGFGRERQEEPTGLITYSGDSHLMTIAPTGAGKTSGPVITNALCHPGQVIAIDMKGEVSAATARARAQIGPVHIIDLRDGTPFQDSLNPFDLARRGGSDLTVLSRILAADFIDRTGQEREAFWQDWAETVLSGMINYMLSHLPEAERNPGKLFELMHPDDFRMQLAVILDTQEDLNPAIQAAFCAFLGLPDRDTRPSVYACATHPIRLFESSFTRRLTDTTSFDLDALIAGEPMSLYFIVPPHRLSAYRPLLRSWITGLIMALAQRTRVPEHRTLMLCDEIGNLGRIEAFVTAATLLRGWGVTLWSFWQSLAQLERYGADAKVLADNAGVLQLFSPRNFRSAREFCDLVGGITPEAVMALRPDEQLLLIEGGAPQIARKVQYFGDALFEGLFDRNPLAPGAEGRQP